MIGLGAKIAIGLVATAGTATAVGLAAVPTTAESQQATVVRHVDGDTFDVMVSGSTQRIRLLNIDTPETRDPDKQVQCLGPEAMDFLAKLVPVGSMVRLEFDRVRQDGYGRTLAAAFTPDGRMVNAEVARAGLAQVITIGGNDRFRPLIEQAAQEAAADKRGLHAEDVPCTLPAEVRSVGEQVAQSPTLASQPPDSTADQLSTAADRAALARQNAILLMDVINHADGDIRWLALTATEQAVLHAKAGSSQDTAVREEAALRSAAGTAKQYEDNVARAAVEAQAQRVAQQQQATQRAQQRRSAATDRARDARHEDNGETHSTPKSAPTAGHAGNPTGYTKERCFEPGGKVWHPCPGHRKGS